MFNVLLVNATNPPEFWERQFSGYDLLGAKGSKEARALVRKHLNDLEAVILLCGKGHPRPSKYLIKGIRLDGYLGPLLIPEREEAVPRVFREHMAWVDRIASLDEAIFSSHPRGTQWERFCQQHARSNGHRPSLSLVGA